MAEESGDSDATASTAEPPQVASAAQSAPATPLEIVSLVDIAPIKFATVPAPAPAATEPQPPPNGVEAPSPRKRLALEEIRDRLRLRSSGLVEEIHALAVRQNQLEDARESRLDAKATGLLGTAGLSLTVAFTFGGMLLQHPEYLVPLGPWLARGALLAYVIALICGLGAVIAAVRALFVTGEYQSVSDDNVFNAYELDTIDRTAKDKDEAQRLYRRFITIQHWSIYRAHFDIHQRKANRIKWGQCLFVAFLLILIIIGALLTGAAFNQYKNIESPKSIAPTFDLPVTNDEH